MVDFFRMVKKGQQIGKVTSAVTRRALRRASATAMGPIKHSEVGTELEVETPRKELRCGGPQAVDRPPKEKESDQDVSKART